MTVWGVGPKLLIPSYAIALPLVWLSFHDRWLFAIPLLPRWFELVLGAIAVIIGMAFWVLSAVVISNGFPEDRLVCESVYGVVRHPMYAGHIVFLVPGLALALDSWLLLLVAGGMYLAFVKLIGREEDFLRDRFGNDYLQYRATVPTLIPFLRPRKARSV